ncbi:hypothetical protein [Streptomyces sp. Amel2xE9]|uniref:hypothetical protein n=1 Tax=Streptomyces sp. Amel2xE9 TaxID=1157634 RepID=UPI0009968F6C
MLPLREPLWPYRPCWLQTPSSSCDNSDASAESATLQTSTKVLVPPFINQGDRLGIDCRGGRCFCPVSAASPNITGHRPLGSGSPV